MDGIPSGLRHPAHETTATFPIDSQHGPTPVVVAYGLGTDSTAMLIGLAARSSVPDLILFADTGSEWPRTYAYVSVISDWLESVGFPPITIVKNRSPIAGDASLYDECHRKSVLPSLAFLQPRVRLPKICGISPAYFVCRK